MPKDNAVPLVYAGQQLGRDAVVGLYGAPPLPAAPGVVSGPTTAPTATFTTTLKGHNHAGPCRRF